MPTELTAEKALEIANNLQLNLTLRDCGKVTRALLQVAMEAHQESLNFAISHFTAGSCLADEQRRIAELKREMEKL